MPIIKYQFDREVAEDDSSLTLLQISLKNHIPHTHACGGMGRCSTCRVLILDCPDAVTPPGEVERAIASRKGFAANVRLACQTRTQGDVSVRRLVRDDTDVRLTALASESTGHEERLAIMFTDVRGFTTFSEQNLPYDVIHVLDRVFYAQGEAIIGNDGYIDKYIGDGVMALFGLDRHDDKNACLSAVKAALEIQSRLAAVRDYLSHYFGVDLQVGIGIHFGTVVVGEVGHPKKRQFTAIGDAVNTASRIESATKEFHARVLVSGDVLAHAGDAVVVGKSCSVTLKGKAGTYPVHEVAGLRD